MASLDSSIRSAARATSSAYRRLPIRWRLAGGSAALTLVILCGFAAIVGVLTTRRIQSDFSRQVAAAAEELSRTVKLRLATREDGTPYFKKVSGPNLDAYAAGGRLRAVVRIITPSGDFVDSSAGAPSFGPFFAQSANIDGWRVESRPVEVVNYPDPVVIQYARRLSDVEATANRVKVFLAFGVLGGALLALLAGLATARRAMEPIAELTAAAREVERSRDPTTRIPRSESEDEVAELARTLEAMLAALNEARTETEATLTRQREFVADASHELRTPLTSVLANLELLEEDLDGEQREAAASALRSSRRMRRLVADLLLLARADAGRVAPHEPVDVSSVVMDAAAELEPVAGDHEISVSAPPGMVVLGRARRAAPARPQPARERPPPHRPRDRGRGPGRPRRRHDRPRGGGRRPGHPRRAARQGLRALLPRLERPRRLQRPRAVDRPRRRGLPQRRGDARPAARRPRRPLRGPPPGPPARRRIGYRSAFAQRSSLSAHTNASRRRSRGRFTGATLVQEPLPRVRLILEAARRLLARQREVRAAHRGGPRDHPVHRAAHRRLERGVIGLPDAIAVEAWA